MAIYLGSNKVTLQGYITDEQESSDAVRFIDYDGEILHEYSKYEFLALSSMPANPSTSRYKSLVGVKVDTDLHKDYDVNDTINGVTDNNGIISFYVNDWYTAWEDWGDYGNLIVDDITWPSPFLENAWDHATYNNGWDAYHFESSEFTLNNKTYKVIIDWPQGENPIGTLQFIELQNSLVPQGWNWSLSDAKAYVQEFGYLDIGQMYITESGDTEIDIYISTELSTKASLAVNGEVDIDWGDNSTHSTVTGTSLTQLSLYSPHDYVQPGNYTIKIHVNSGSFAFYTPSPGSYFILSHFADTLKVKRIRIGENCYIGDYTFNSCYSLSSITIPNTVTSIGTQAFYECYSLQSITIPSGITSIRTSVFSSCYSLKSITIPNTVTSINPTAFYDCRSLSSITIPNTVTSIGSNAFQYCYSLIKKIGPKFNIIYNGTIIDKLENIFDYAFSDSHLLEPITIPENTVSINVGTFDGCYSLKSITIPDSVTSIGNNAFYYCYSLQSITIPSGVTSIGTSAFNSCCSLSSITIPNTVTSIGSNAFSSCYSLKSITIPNTVTSINSNSFQYCYSLQSITIPNTVTSIGSYAFGSCSSLQSITIPDTVTSISSYTFQYCRSLSSITIPNTVTSIGSYAFAYCNNMKECHLKPITPPTLSNTNAFNAIPSDCIFYVPQGTLSAYQSATNWSTYASKMQEETN